LGSEIKPVGSSKAEMAARLAETPMMSVPFYGLTPLLPSNPENESDSRIGFS
jgi:hypothetical protein